MISRPIYTPRGEYGASSGPCHKLFDSHPVNATFLQNAIFIPWTLAHRHIHLDAIQMILTVKAVALILNPSVLFSNQKVTIRTTHDGQLLRLYGWCLEKDILVIERFQRLATRLANSSFRPELRPSTLENLSSKPRCLASASESQPGIKFH